MGFIGHFLYNTKKVMLIFPIVPKINDLSIINVNQINAKEKYENVNVLSRKLHFCENCYIWGKAIAGTVKHSHP